MTSQKYPAAMSAMTRLCNGEILASSNALLTKPSMVCAIRPLPYGRLSGSERGTLVGPVPTVNAGQRAVMSQLEISPLWSDKRMLDHQLGKTLEEAAERAALILSSIIPDAHCVVQEWGNRIDCFIVSDGKVIGEMILLAEITERRIRETADRLRQRREGIAVPLINSMGNPVRIVRSTRERGQSKSPRSVTRPRTAKYKVRR